MRGQSARDFRSFCQFHYMLPHIGALSELLAGGSVGRTQVKSISTGW